MLLIGKDALNYPEVKAKIFIMLSKISISNKCCSFKLSIHQRIINACIMVSKAKILGSKNRFQH